MDRPFPAYKGDEPYVFVSYSHSDAAAVYPELVWLKESGFNLWYDEGIEAGTEWREEIASAVENARVILFFVTPASAQSENCRREIDFALDQHIPIVAVHLEPTDLSGGLKMTLSEIQAILKYELLMEEYQQKLLARVTSYLDQEVVQQPRAAQKKKSTMAVLAGAAVVIILVLGVYFFSQQEEKQTVDVAAEPDITAATQEAEPVITDKVDIAAMRSIAVLPFANMSTSEEAGFLAQGLSEDILDNLAKSKWLKVASRSGSFQFTGQGVDPSLVGEKLKVAYLLEGSVRQQGDNVRITAQLIRTIDGYHVWSKSYERNLTDGFEMQTAIAVNIAHIAQSERGFDVFENYGWKQSEAYAGIDPIAVGHFLSAYNEFRKIRLGEGGSWDTRVQLLKNAIDVDPSFLEAYHHLVSTNNDGHRAGRLPLQTARPQAHAAINNAMKLDPNNPGIQFQLAQVHLGLDLDYAQSWVFFEQNLERNPKSPWSHLFLASIDLREGRTSDALKRLISAADSDATSLGAQRGITVTLTSLSLCVAGDCERALEGSVEALELATGGQSRADALMVYIHNLLRLGRVEEARPLIDEAWRLDGSINPERYVFFFAQIGETEKARDILSDSRYDLIHHFFLALGHLALGDIDNTFREIEAGIENHDIFLLNSLLVAEWWDPIRDDPRFEEMLALLDSKVTHTERYLRDHKVTQPD